MNNPTQFYTNQKQQLESELKKVKSQLINISICRLAIFLLTATLIYMTYESLYLAIPIGFVGLIIFSKLILKFLQKKKTKELILTKIKLNTIELEVLKGDYEKLDSGTQFINPQHVYSHDIDLFGKGSLFQYLNRTSTEEGTVLLANTLTENNIDFIENKQKAIQDLSQKPKWRQHFSALASLVKLDINSTIILNFISSYKSQFSKLAKKLPLVFSILSLLFIFSASFNLVSVNLVVTWFFIGLGVTAFYIKRTQNIYTTAGKSKDLFKQYYQLLEHIENETFSSSILVSKQKDIQSEREKASAIFRKFSKILDAFDQRNNLFVVFLGNGFFLWDLRNAVNVEKWIDQYKHTVKQWFDTIAFFDAQNSLGNFNFNHPNYSFPKITNSTAIIKATELGHPLLKVAKRVDNNFSINSKEFFIVTGANMAGKSTFLRTVSLSIVMANIGLPVCAKMFEYCPIKLITSMRTSDSLAEDESYFYSELKRLKFIVDKIQVEDYFIILDEILKGTNSKDKAIGSKKFVEKLVSSKSTGIIATHDVSLCELEQEFSEIKNYYFDADITNDELSFDYQFKKGVCKNMNASFLLKKMKIV